MPDGQPLFSAVHGNLLPAKPLDAASFTAAAQALASQTSAGRALHLQPAVLLVGTALTATAHALVTTMTPAGSTAPLQVVVDDRVPGTDWYLCADPGTAAVIVTARLTSAAAPGLLARDAWNIDGRQYKGRDTFGAAAVAWQGMVKTPGA